MYHNNYHNHAHNKNHVSRKNSCCCCECIRLNSHLLTGRAVDEHQHYHHSYQYSDVDDEPMNLSTKFPSAHYRIDLEEKKHFFEHFKNPPPPELTECLEDDDEYLTYNNNRNPHYQRPVVGPRFVPQRRINRWEKPQQRKFYPYLSSPPQVHPNSSIYRQQRRDQETQTDLRYYSDYDNSDDGCGNGYYNEQRINYNAAAKSNHYSNRNNHQKTSNNNKESSAKQTTTFYANKKFHYDRKQYPQSDMEYPQQSTKTKTEHHNHSSGFSNQYHYNNAPKNPLAKIRTYKNATTFTENETEKDDEEYLRQQSSQAYLNKVKIVKSRKPEWEERIANDNKYQLRQVRNHPHRKINTEILVHKTTSSTTLIGQGKGKVRGDPLSFTSSSEEESVVERKPYENPSKLEKSEFESDHQKNQSHEIKNVSNTVDLKNEQKNEVAEEKGTEEVRHKLSARPSNSLPAFQEEKKNQDVEELTKESKKSIQTKAKSVPTPTPGKFKHPELQELNLSSMRLPNSQTDSTKEHRKGSDFTKDHRKDSESTEKHRKDSDSTNKQIHKYEILQSRESIIEEKYFKKWKAAGTRKYPKPTVQESFIKDGLQILSQSKSQQNIQNYTSLRKSENNGGGGSIISTVSAPPRPKRWYNLLDSINPFASSTPEPPPADPESTKVQKDVAQILANNTASAIDVKFAIEIDTQIPTEHATYYYHDETLRHISKDYDDLIETKQINATLDIRHSNSTLNTSMKNASETNTQLGTKTDTKARTTSHYKHKGVFAWREKGSAEQKQTTMQNKSKSPSDKPKICQNCLLTITDEEEEESSTPTIIGIPDRHMYWHIKCFKCTICEIQLKESNHYFWSNKIYCSNHFAFIARLPKCQACSQPIFDSTYTNAMNYSWHTHHFKCLSCQKYLIDTKFVKVGEDSAMCFDCQQKWYLKKCVFCGKSILPTEIYARSGNHFWHSNETCLQCQTCHKDLRTHSRIFVRSGKTYCNRYCAQMFISPAISLSHENPELPT